MICRIFTIDLLNYCFFILQKQEKQSKNRLDSEKLTKFDFHEVVNVEQ